jgi:hypothetical protein
MMPNGLEVNAIRFTVGVLAVDSNSPRTVHGHVHELSYELVEREVESHGAGGVNDVFYARDGIVVGTGSVDVSDDDECQSVTGIYRSDAGSGDDGIGFCVTADGVAGMESRNDEP